MSKAFVVNAEWDQEASVWIATSEDVPGLCAQAASLEELVEVVKSLVPELLEANQALPTEAGPIPLDIMARRQAFAHVAA
jgi:predicted RNase H-like HicB family nuclease